MWTAVDDYFSDVLISPDPILDQTIQESNAARLPPHQVAPN